MKLFQRYLSMISAVLFCLLLGLLRPVEPAAVLQTTPSPNVSSIAPKTVKDIEKEIEGMITMVSKMALPYFVRNSDLKLSSKCMSTVIKMFMDVRKLKLPVIKLLDAMAKPPYGLLKGSFSIMGDYDECLEVSANKKGDVPLKKEDEFYHGQYCTVEIDFPKSVVDTIIDYNNGRTNISAFGKLGSFIEEFPGTNFAGSFFKYLIGACIPSTCTKEDLQEVLGLVPVDFLPISVKHCDEGIAKQLNVDQAVFISFLILFGVMVFSGTCLEAWYYVCKPNFNGYHNDRFVQFLMAFSVYGNTKKLMKAEKGSSGGDIAVVNGMYVMGTFLVIIYHTYLMPFFLTFSSHGAFLGEYLKDFHFTLISTMGISIEAYFIFSGLFLVYPRFRRQQKEVQVNVLKILVRRYIRLCPSMLVILGVIVFLPLIGSGPVWADIFGVAAENTRKWWWTYVLMFNNFLPIKDQNFLYFWFIPCLMQCSIVGAILLWTMAKYEKLGIILTVLTGLACNVTLGVLTAIRHYPPTYAIYYIYNREQFEEPIYTAPLSHMFSFGIGMLLGLYMAKNPSLKWSKTHVITGWITSLLLTVGIQFVAYVGHDGLDPDPIFASIYAATHRTIFSLGLAWIILACNHGYGGFFGKILSWKGFAVLSKLGYFGYLIHYVIIAFHVSYTRVPLMFSHYEIFMRFSAYSVLTFAAAYILYVTFESPLVFVESLFLPTRTPSVPEVQNNTNSKGGATRADVLAAKYMDVINPNLLKSPWNDIQSCPEDKEKAEHSKL